MIRKTNIDVQIYVDQLMEGINQMGLIEIISEEWGVTDQEEFKELLTENLMLKSLINFEDDGDPILGEIEFEDILIKSATEYTVNSMVDEGLLTKNLSDGEIENTYSINPEIKIVINGKEDN